MSLSELAKAWWYYTVELEPGVVAAGQYAPHLPFLPRILMRSVDVSGMDCLDLGTMEALIPALLKRRGAARVLAADAIDHCRAKIDAVQKAYDVEFDYARVGLMYDLSRKIPGGFDFINLSGLLYHVFSPLHVLAGVRPLLKRDGLMVVSTNVVNRQDYTAEWNAGGRLQPETNTFWYLSIPTFEDMLRYFRLRPVDCLYTRHSAGHGLPNAHGLDTGYLSVLCRATDEETVSDRWSMASRAQSWEVRGLCDFQRAAQQARSTVAGPDADLRLFEAAQDPARQVISAGRPQDGHTLMLADLD